MNDTELNEIEKRAANATPGPWVVETGDYSGNNWLLGSSTIDGKDYSLHLTTDHINASNLYGDAKTDADFIAHARQDIPALIAEVRRLNAENARLRAELAEMAHPTDTEIIADNDRLRAALEFYANFYEDGGVKARKALNGKGGEG